MLQFAVNFALLSLCFNPLIIRVPFVSLAETYSRGGPTQTGRGAQALRACGADGGHSCDGWSSGRLGGRQQERAAASNRRHQGLLLLFLSLLLSRQIVHEINALQCADQA